MKRKKQAEESTNGHYDELNQKPPRSGRTARQGIEEDDGHDEVEAATPKKISSRKVKDNEEYEEDAESQNTPTKNDDEVSENDGVEVEEVGGSTGSEEGGEEAPSEALTPTKTTNERLGNNAKKAPANGNIPVKDLRGKNLFSTPHKTNGTTDDTPKLERHVDRSARRKSTRNLIERTVLGNTSDNDEGEDIEGHIYGLREEDAEEDEIAVDEIEMGGDIPVSAQGTPSKTPGWRKRSKKKEPSPLPTNLPPHELYFSQNRNGRSKTSNNNLSSLQLLDHEEYFTLLRKFKDPHADDIEWLQELHAGSFNQWQFELSQDFNICIFGWGSKRSLLMKFAEHIYKSEQDHTKNKIVVVNGYVQTLTIRDVLNTVGAAISEAAPKLGSQPSDMLENLLALLEEDNSRHFTVIIHEESVPT